MNDNQSLIDVIFNGLEENTVLDNAEAYNGYDKAINDIVSTVKSADKTKIDDIALRNEIFSIISDFGISVSRVAFTEGFKTAIKLIKEAV